MTNIPREYHDLAPGMGDQHILLIDDHAVFRLGLRLLLCETFSAARVSEADSLEQAMEQTRQAPDLVLLDIKLPGLNGIEGTALLKARWPHTRIIILSSLEAPEAIDEALGYGAAGYLSKGESAERLLAGIRDIIDGPGAPGKPGAPAATEAESEVASSRLTPRQRETLEMLCQGLSNKLIAKQLALAENTVRRHVQDILEHFQVDSRSEAVFAARRRGLIE